MSMREHEIRNKTKGILGKQNIHEHLKINHSY